MPLLAMYGAILFTVAFFFYTLGVWAERFAKRLKPWHAVAFFLGVVADTIATALMAAYTEGVLISAHSIIGMLGLILMIIHFFWAVMVLRKNDEKALTSFHRFSVFVWGVWMVAYLSGIYVGIQQL